MNSPLVPDVRGSKRSECAIPPGALGHDCSAAAAHGITSTGVITDQAPSRLVSSCLRSLARVGAGWAVNLVEQLHPAVQRHGEQHHHAGVQCVGGGRPAAQRGPVPEHGHHVIHVAFEEL
jgi:hypothetical protein